MDTSLPGLAQAAKSRVTPYSKEGITRPCHWELSLGCHCHPPASVPHSHFPAHEKCLGPVALVLAPPSQRVVRAGSPPGTTRSASGLHPVHAGATVSPLVALVVVTCPLSQHCSQHKAKSQAICTQADQSKKKKKRDCKHPVPAWHSPNKRFADAAQAGLGLQCAKSRLSVSLIAAAISPGWSFPEPCSPQPPQQTFFFFFLLQSLYLPCICYPSCLVGVRPSKGGERQEICTCHLLLCSSQELSHPPSPCPAQPVAAAVRAARPSSRGRTR